MTGNGGRQAPRACPQRPEARLFRSFKWLYPGLGIKRWILVIFFGAVLFSAGAASLIFGMLASESERSRDAYSLAALLFALGALALAMGVYRLMKSIGGLLSKSSQHKDLLDIAYEQRALARGPRVVALGGGTGMSGLLTGLKNHTREITAIVSVADDGGSSGRLRREFDIAPPGDIRKCLIALSEEAPLMGKLLGYRFNESDLEGHAFGNLFLTVLTRITGDFGEAVREANNILSVRGRVVPATLERVFLVATHTDGSKTTGQRLISESTSRIERVDLKPNPGRAASDILQAIEEADLIVLGPGSLYTSVSPNLLIDGIVEAIRRSKARKVYVCNVMTHEGETAGYSFKDHVDALEKHSDGRICEYVLANSGRFPRKSLVQYESQGGAPVRFDAAEYSNNGGVPPFKVVEADLVDRERMLRHEPDKLASALMDILGEASET